MALPEFIIAVFCAVDQILHELGMTDLRQRGPKALLSDAEVLTMEIVGEFLGIDTEVGLWRYFREHYSGWFPRLGSRSSFTKQMAHLWQVKQVVQRALVQKMGSLTDPMHMVDGVPVPVCHIARAPRARLFPGEATHGYCASKKQYFYGFKGHICISFHGVICGFTLSPAHSSEREAVWELLPPSASGLLLGDKGYLGKDFQEQIQFHTGLCLQTPLKDNMHDDRPKTFVSAMMNTRRKVETVIGQLTERFHLNKVRARNLWHLTSRIARKLLAHTMAAFLRDHGRGSCLDFDNLIAY